LADHAIAVAQLYGHDPRDVREWAWADCERLLIMHHTLYS
jgi:hypothetical protein